MPLDRPTAEELQRVMDHHAAHRETGEASVFLDRVAAQLDAILARQQATAAACDGERVGGEAGESVPESVAQRFCRQEADRLQSLLCRQGSASDLHRELCLQIRAGALDWRDTALMTYLRWSVDGRLAIDNPRYKG